MNKACILIYCFFLCLGSWAEPDVFFVDSDSYDGAYLTHEFKDDKIKFLLTKPILNFKLRDEYFDLEELKNYINNIYQFSDNSTRSEFKRMLKESFKSQLKAEEFLVELLNVLAGFKPEAAAPVPTPTPEKSSGGCQSMSGNQQSTNYFFLFLALIYGLQRNRFLKGPKAKSHSPSV